MSVFTEDTYEQALIELFEELGYSYQYGPDLERDYRNPLLEEQLLESLRRLNPTLPVSALEDVVKALRQIEGSSPRLSSRHPSSSLDVRRTESK